MSLFPNKRLSISLSPTAIAGIAYVGRWRPHPIDHREFYFEDKGLTHTLAGLDEALKCWAAPGALVRMTVSNRYMRTALLPWAGVRLSTHEFSVLAQQQFRDCYGDMDGWEIRIDRNQGYGKGAIAFAIPTILLNEIEQLCRQYKLICDGIVPSAIASWNRHSDIGSTENFLYGALEAEQLWLLATQGIGRDCSPVAVRMLTMPAESLPFSSLRSAVEREILLQGLPLDSRVVLEGFGQLPDERLGRIDIAPSHLGQSVAMEMAWAGGWA